MTNGIRQFRVLACFVALLIALAWQGPAAVRAADTPAKPPVAGAAVNVAPAAPAKPAAPAQKVLSGPVKPEEMKGVDWTGLTEAQKQVAMDVMLQERCGCSCGMTIAVCRRDDPTCPSSPGLAAKVIEQAKLGKSKDEVVKALSSGQAYKFVAFNLPTTDAPTTGPDGAKVKILYYTDHQCPFCIRLGATLDELVKLYPNDVQIVYKQHPLAMHQQAGIAAQAALAAAKQGKFYEMHKQLYEKTRELSRDKVIEIAKDLKLDEAKFVKDLDSPEVKAQIDRETKEVENLGAQGTPACFVNGRYVSGAKPLEFWKSMVEEELAWAKAGNRPQFTVGKNIKDSMPPQAAQQRGPDPNKAYDLKLAGAPALGAAKPTVTILHYYDYQCPFCVRLAPTLEKILADYPADVQIGFKQHPLGMHNQAMISAEAVMAANAQGKFEPMHKKLHEMNAQPNRDKIMEAAKTIPGLDMAKFTSDIDSHAYKAQIDAMTAEAMGVGATGTPASFVNGRYLSGAQPYEAFKKIIDEEIAKVKGGAAAQKTEGAAK